MSSREGEAVAPLMDRLMLQAGDLQPDNVIDAFKPDASIQARASIILLLSQSKEDIASLFSKRIPKCLASQEPNDAESFAAIRFMTSLFSVTSEAAQQLLFESGHITTILSMSASAAGKNDYMLAFITSELLCAAANHPKSRRWILKSSEEEINDSNKIVEIDQHSGEELTVMHWLLSFIEKANVENASSGSILSKVALISCLALYKIQRGSKGKEKDEEADLSSGQSAEEEAREKEKRLEEDELLYQLAKSHLVQDEGRGVSFLATYQNTLSMNINTRDELERVCRLSSVESLTYLSLDTAFRDVMVESQDLLVKLCQLGLTASCVPDEKSSALFPNRGADGSQNMSKYELDKHISASNVSASSGLDTALQYALATLLTNIMAYPSILSAEDRQMEKLRRMANAKEKVKGATGEEDNKDPRMEMGAVEGRVDKVIRAGGVQTLSSFALGFAREGRVNTSPAFRETVSKAMLSMTTKQDKLQRGRIIQEGGAKALLKLSNQWIADELRGKEAPVKPSFAPMQALAHLLITENPNLVIKDTAECIPSLVYLYLHSASSRLQRFEAALALTNVASLGEVTTRGITSCGFPRRVVDTTFSGGNEFVGVGALEQSKVKVKIDSVLHERIFLEENEMSRRSSLELLCNLLVDDEIFKQWSGELEDEEHGTNQSKDEDEEHAVKDGRVMKNLIFLIALCSPLGLDQVSGEVGLKLRMAASGAVATLASSPSTCARLLALESRVLSKVSRLVHPSNSTLKQANEEEEKSLHDQDISDDPLGSHHASLQLSLRGLTCLDCLVQYVGWIQSQGTRNVTLQKHKLVEAGCVEAIKSLALSLAKNMKVTSPNPAIQSLQDQVAQQSFTSLRACKELGLL